MICFVLILLLNLWFCFAAFPTQIESVGQTAALLWPRRFLINFGTAFATHIFVISRVFETAVDETVLLVTIKIAEVVHLLFRFHVKAVLFPSIFRKLIFWICAFSKILSVTDAWTIMVKEIVIQSVKRLFSDYWFGLCLLFLCQIAEMRNLIELGFEWVSNIVGHQCIDGLFIGSPPLIVSVRKAEPFAVELINEHSLSRTRHVFALSLSDLLHRCRIRRITAFLCVCARIAIRINANLWLFVIPIVSFWFECALHMGGQ